MSGDPAGLPRFAHAPVVWRSTLRGVLVLGDELLLLEGLAATIWVALDDGPTTVDGIVRDLGEWDLEVAEADVAAMADELRSMGVLVTTGVPAS